MRLTRCWGLQNDEIMRRGDPARYFAAMLGMAWLSAFAAEEVMPLAALPNVVVEPAGQVALGRILFFDPILSATKSVACASCHQPRYGWTDARKTAIGATRVPLSRNTLSILNTAFMGGAVAPMFWDAREHGLEAQVLHPLRARDEMRGDACSEADALRVSVEHVRSVHVYRKMFDEVFEGEPSVHRMAQAIASFERTLIASNSPFDRFMRGDSAAMSDAATRGMKAFERAGCIQCHGGPMLSDFKLHVIAVPGERRAFRTPSLRQLKFTAPYMHDGSMRSLDEVLSFYEQLMDEVSESLEGGDASADPPLDPLLRKLDLHVEDFEDLKAFIDALNDPGFDQTIPDKVPSGLQPGGARP